MMGTAPMGSFAAGSDGRGTTSRYDAFGPLSGKIPSPTHSESGGKNYENIPLLKVAEKADSEKHGNSSTGNKRRNSRREREDGGEGQCLPFPAPRRRRLDDNEAESALKRNIYGPARSIAKTPKAESTIDSEVQRAMASKYELGELIGEGTYSKVYRACERGSSLACAMKVVSKNHRKLLASGNLYEKEILILQNCKPHPNVIKVHHVMRSGTHICLAMDLAVGGDLFSRMKREGRFSEELSVRTIKMVLNGVSHLHRNGITHRDLKLENLLYKTDMPDSDIVISDFGLAHQKKTSDSEITECSCKSCNSNCELCRSRFFAMNGECGMSTTCGTPEYLSPEMLDGEIYTEKVDMWAVGVVAYAMLSGEMPFSNEDGGGRGRAKMYQRIKEADYSVEAEVWSEISEAAKHFLSVLLCVDVAERLDAHSALHHPWLSS